MIRLILAFILSVGLVHAAEKKELDGLVLVLDAGHGGIDPGAHGVFSSEKGNVTIYEAPYVWDTVCRIRAIAKAHGAVVIMTTWDYQGQCRRDARGTSEVIPLNRDLAFAYDRSSVTADKAGLQKRIRRAHFALARFPKHRVVFLSVHFDSLGTASYEGAHVIVPPEKPVLGEFLLDEFRKERRTRRDRSGREYHPLAVIGDTARNLYVLRSDRNRVNQRAMLELGNFGNASDVWRIRDYRVREAYAQIVLRALIRANRIPFVEAR